LLLVVTVAVPFSAAQIRGATGGRGFAGHSGFGRGFAGRNGLYDGNHGRNHGVPLAFPLFGSYYDSNYGLDFASNYDDWNYSSQPVDGEGQESRPQVVLMQPAAEAQRKTKPGPLLIEWQGDRYVRFGGANVLQNSESAARPDYVQPVQTKEAANSGRVSSRQNEQTELRSFKPQPAVLVYRNGQREEVADYAIASGFVYINTSDGRNGSETKSIALSALDAAATIQANEQRGVKFLLPSASNVVVASF
jgi:hypothetical protein